MSEIPRSGEASQPLPERFGRYRIIKRLGAGGMGSVHLAEDTQLGRRVALKVPHFGPEDGPEARERFFREASLAATLDHVHLCPVYDVGEVDGLCFLTMAYIEGNSLAETIPEAGLPPRRAAALVRKLALGLQEAHAKGVIHRDLKPANIMLKETRQGREPVIVDFGLAHRDDVGKVRVTKTGQVLGTLGYMSPEQIRGDPTAIGPACDIYALGVILYELLTGELPFRGSGLAVAGQILTQEPPPLVELRPDVDVRLEPICLKAMAKKVEDRYTSMGALATALGDYLRPSSMSTQTLPVGRQRPEGFAAWARPVLALGMVLLGSIVAWVSGVFQGKKGDDDAVRESMRTHQVEAENARLRWELEAAQSKPYQPTSRGRNEARQLSPPKEAVPKVTLNQPPPQIAKVKSSPREPVAAARPSQASEEALKAITNIIGMKLVLIPAGEFLMGSPASDNVAQNDERPQHRVRITRPFYLGSTEVTQGQYRAVTGQSPSGFKGSDDLPVAGVSWNDAIAFCNGLSIKEGLDPYYTVERVTAKMGRKPASKVLGSRVSILSGYCLPTEAEWEYACRAGSTTRYSFGDEAAGLGEFAWYDGNSGEKPHPVGKKRPNAWDLFDMHGNHWEWCQDWYDRDYYGRSPGADPLGPPQATLRVLRGGGFYLDPRLARSAMRLGLAPAPPSGNAGFRVARVQSAPNQPPSPIAEVKPAPTEPAPAARPTPAPEETPKEITNTIGMKLVLIPSGEFLMGSPDSDKDAQDDERPQHQVHITRPFFLGGHEVTRGQFKAVIGADPSGFKGSDDLPVEVVSWNDAIAFCNGLSVMEGLDPYYTIERLTEKIGRKPASKAVRARVPLLGGYCLPTEAEWEHACRAGSTTRYSFGDDAARLGEFAWYDGNSGKKPHPVGQKLPNAWGLFDMYGNVSEWCSDLYNPSYYRQSPGADPLGPSQATVRVLRAEPTTVGTASPAARVIRGGSWNSYPLFARSADRYESTHEARSGSLGFRVARVQSDR